MKVKALVSFSGIITMAKNQETEIKDKAIYNDLLQAGYIENAEGTKTKNVFDKEQIEELGKQEEKLEEISITEEVTEDVKANEN